MHRAFIILWFLSMAAVAKATDIDLFGGLEWTEVGDEDVIRLLGVYPDALPEDLAPGAYRVLTPENGRNRYGEVLAHVILADGSWLQNTLVAEGKAIVMPVYERDASRLQFLLAEEEKARTARLGLWRRSPVVCAYLARGAFDTFAVIQGRVVAAADVRGTIYLNFGEDWRDDFTIKITKSVFKRLPEEIRVQITRLTESEKPDSVIEARGWVFFSGGPMIEVKTPAQISFLEDDNPLREGRCVS